MCSARKKVKGFKHDTPLIKTDVKKIGKAEIEKDAKMGPVPAEADTTKFVKRKKNIICKRKKLPFNFRRVSKLKTNCIFQISKHGL